MTYKVRVDNPADAAELAYDILVSSIGEKQHETRVVLKQDFYANGDRDYGVVVEKIEEEPTRLELAADEFLDRSRERARRQTQASKDALKTPDGWADAHWNRGGPPRYRTLAVQSGTGFLALGRITDGSAKRKQCNRVGSHGTLTVRAWRYPTRKELAANTVLDTVEVAVAEGPAS